MAVVVVTGSCGLVGYESCLFFSNLGFDVVGIDNNMRKYFFGDTASTEGRRVQLENTLGRRYRHFDVDIRDSQALIEIFRQYGDNILLVIHTAAQPSHDWAAREPLTDFTVNAQGTLNILEAVRHNAPGAVFIFCSTNKVYGDTPNKLPLIELEKRWEISTSHPYFHGISEDMSIDHSLHSLFGTSKVAADLLVQEYGRYFGLQTVCFRGGCLTGPYHAGVELHGFLSYLMKCTITGKAYTIFGYKGKQVRDNIHSADLVRAFYEFYRAPRVAAVYNIGGSRHSNCSILEAIAMCQEIAGRELNWAYTDSNRVGDHIWYVSDVEKFKSHYPDWRLTYDIPAILSEIYELHMA